MKLSTANVFPNPFLVGISRRLGTIIASSPTSMFLAIHFSPPGSVGNDSCGCSLSKG